MFAEPRSPRDFSGLLDLPPEEKVEQGRFSRSRVSDEQSGPFLDLFDQFDDCFFRRVRRQIREAQVVAQGFVKGDHIERKIFRICEIELGKEENHFHVGRVAARENAVHKGKARPRIGKAHDEHGPVDIRTQCLELVARRPADSVLPRMDMIDARIRRLFTRNFDFVADDHRMPGENAFHPFFTRHAQSQFPAETAPKFRFEFGKGKDSVVSPVRCADNARAHTRFHRIRPWQ